MFRQYIPSEVPKLEDYNSREQWIEALKEYTCKLHPMDAIKCLYPNEEA